MMIKSGKKKSAEEKKWKKGILRMRFAKLRASFYVAGTAKPARNVAANFKLF
jgi:hypothetical protein